MAYWIDQARNRRRYVHRAGECTGAVKTELVVLRVVIFVVSDGPVAQTFRVKVKRSSYQLLYGILPYSSSFLTRRWGKFLRNTCNRIGDFQGVVIEKHNA